MSYSEQLYKFLEQAKTTNLKYGHYQKKYKDLKVKVSFGLKEPAKIPWISFLHKPFTSSNGIYPVYLYYKDKDLLILSYGVSETNKLEISWGLEYNETIDEYFHQNEWGKPNRYGTSYIYKVYEVDKLPGKDILNQDLNALIDIYKKKVHQKVNLSAQTNLFDKEEFQDALSTAGLLFSDQMVTRFVASLLTKPFVILSGLSGSGKTKLAQSFADWICKNEQQYAIVPVGADWTNREPLLGYPDALDASNYIEPDHRGLELIIKASKNQHLPYFLILDEMNLSHVERYFADFLSVLESSKPIALYDNKEIRGIIPSEISLPKNLFIIGTVNIDETTYMFSPKVLDRANVIEFRVSKSSMQQFLTQNQPLNMKALSAKGDSMAQHFVILAKTSIFEEQLPIDYQATLLAFFDQLQKVSAEFGYRSATEIIRLLQQLKLIDSDIMEDDQLDIAIMQKLLPKLHGSRNKLTGVLTVLGNLCFYKGIENIEKEIFTKKDFDYMNSDIVRYPISLEKISRMYRSAIENGFASYAEA